MFEPRFQVGEVLSYSEILEEFKCQQGKGMACSAATNSLVLITDSQKKKAGSIYDDAWDEHSVFHYRGTGQRGDQRLDYEGNAWLNRSTDLDIGVFLVEKIATNTYRFRGRVLLVEQPYQRREPDVDGNPRWVWVFPLVMAEPDQTVWRPADFPGEKTVLAEQSVAYVVSESEQSDSSDPTHSQIQWALLSIGSGMGLELWVARNDRDKVFKGQRMGDMPGIREALPVQFPHDVMRVIEHIDVLWLHGNLVVAAFEVEHTTSVYSGLLRMSDLLALAPNINMPLYVVAPGSRREKVRRELLRPTFLSLRPPLSECCAYISYERLLEIQENAGNYLSHMSPAVLADIAERFSDRK